MKTTIKTIVFVSISFILLTGCWDTVSIEDRGFIVGSAIDIDEQQDADHPILTVTNQMVLPAGMSSSVESDGGEQQPFLNFTMERDSTYEVDEEIVSRSSKQPFYEHLSVLVISEEVARTEELFENLLDTYIRDVDFRRGIYVVVSKDKAKDILDFTTSEEQLPAKHIEKILEQGSKQVGNISPKTVGDLEEYHLEGNSYILPYVETEEEFVEQKQGAVFHGRLNKMVGLFNEEEMHGFELMTGNQQVKIIDFNYEGKTLALKVLRIDNKLTVDPSNLEEIKAKVKVELKGTIKESFFQKDLTDPKEIDALQKAIGENVKHSIEKAIAKGQEEFGTDVYGVWEEIRMKHYDTWKKIEGDWEEGEYYFKNVTFDIDVIPQIYSTGTTNRTKESD